MQTKNILAPISHLLTLERKDLIVILWLTLAIGILNLATPLAVQTLVNIVTMGGVIKPLIVVSFVLFVLLVLSGLIYVVELIIVEYIKRRIYASNVTQMTKRILKIDLKVSDTHYPAELMNRYFDLGSVQTAFYSLITVGLTAVLHAIIGSVVLIIYSFYFAVIVFLVLLATWFIMRVLGRHAINTAVAESYAKYDTGAWLENIANNSNLFKFSDGENYAIKGSDKLVVEYLHRRQSHFSILLKQNIITVIIYALAGTVMLGIGGWLVMRAEINLGQFVAAELIIFTVLGSFSNFVKQLSNYYELVAGLDKLEVVKTIDIEPSGKHEFDQNHALAVRLKNVSYQFNANIQPITNFSLAIAADEKLAILADAGLGKTTLAELITGLRQPTEGQIIINDVDLRLCNLPSLRQKMNLSRRIEIQQTSILNNLQLNNPDIKLEEVNALLKRLDLLDVILDLPDGLDTELTVMGTPLSTVQVKLIMIARALLQNPKLLILDGLLDEIDATSAQLVCRILSEQNDCTVVVMTRSTAIAQHFTRIIKWDDFGADAKQVHHTLLTDSSMQGGSQ